MGTCSYTWKEWDEKKGQIEKRCQNETWAGSDEYCIFHDPSPEKDAELFRQKMEERTDVNFRGYVFPGRCDFQNKKFHKGVVFQGVTFQGPAFFRGATFRGIADFGDTTFQGADFGCTVFQENADFGGASFQNASFSRASFQKDVDFIGASFKEVYFIGASFQKDVDFRDTSFQNASFRGTIFQNANFIDASFQNNADFNGAVFQRNTSFIRADFQNASFRGTIFQKNTDFRDTSFQKDVDFIGASFKEVYFIGASFQKDVDFRDTSFQNASFRGTIFQNANFNGANFQNISFRDASFQNNADFNGTTFQTASFIDASFQNNADFNGAVFQRNTSFIRADFQNASFRGTTFQIADFRNVTIKESFDFNPKEVSGILDLRESKFFFSGLVTVNLEKAKFHHAHLQNVAFIDCNWPDNYVIYEEKEMINEGLSFKELETVYRNLKQNIQNHGDYTTAGNLYYREMEMRRKGTETKRGRLWLELYRILAGYGEKPERTAFSSALTIFAFAFFYGISGCLHYTIQNPCLYQQIKDSIYFSFVTFTTLGLGDIRPLNDLGKLLICCEAIIGAFLIALFVVVFARKMMR